MTKSEKMSRQVEYNRRWREKNREKYNEQQRLYKRKRTIGQAVKGTNL